MKILLSTPRSQHRTLGATTRNSAIMVSEIFIDRPPLLFYVLGPILYSLRWFTSLILIQSPGLLCMNAGIEHAFIS